MGRELDLDSRGSASTHHLAHFERLVCLISRHAVSTQ
jgi:hypothetical protein